MSLPVPVLVPIAGMSAGLGWVYVADARTRKAVRVWGWNLVGVPGPDGDVLHVRGAQLRTDRGLAWVRFPDGAEAWCRDVVPDDAPPPAEAAA